MKLEMGLRVRVTTENPGGFRGFFDGTITAVGRYEVAVSPDSLDIQRMWDGVPYMLGRAHWVSNITVLPELENE